MTFILNLQIFNLIYLPPMQSKIKIGLRHFCCWILLLQLLNLSIDPVRHQNLINGELTFQEDLSINKIESLYELVLEYVFKKDVPETQDHANHSTAKAFFFYHQTPNLCCKLILTEKPVMHNHSYIISSYEQIHVLESPPPKRSA